MSNTDHLYWIGGSPCAGKTTIADMIAQEHDWQVYHIDRHVESYLDRADPEQHPYLTEYKTIGLKRFLQRPPDDQLQRVLGLSREYLHFILMDVAEMPDDTPILIEGANLRPADLMPHLTVAHHVIWMTPDEDFLFKTYPRRGTWVQDVLRYHYPEEERGEIFEKWMTRDALHAEWARDHAAQQDFLQIHVDGSHTIRQNAAIVEAHFGLPPHLADI